MTEFEPPQLHGPFQPLPPGDPGYITPLTQIIWADDSDFAPGVNVMVGVDVEHAQTVIAIRKGLSAASQATAMHMLYAELRRQGASRIAAVALVAMIPARRCLQPAQRLMHHLQQVPQTVWDNVSGPAIATAAGTAIALGAASVAVVGSGITSHGPGGPLAGSPAWHRQHPVHLKLPATPLAYLGVYEPTSPGSYAGIGAFAALSGRRPNVALYYSGWGEGFQAGFADQAAANGAIPAVQLNPEVGASGMGVSLADIAAGKYDTYLTSYADAVATYGKGVIISFGPEVNGTWYPWSQQSPADYIAAWRHIVGVFRMQGAGNVTWMWTVSRVGGAAGAATWWPGAGYVNWVGIDGYYRHSSDTWATVFGPAITAIRNLTSIPILISETAIGPVGTEPSQLRDMYSNLRAGHYLGLIWFDESKPGLPYALAGDPGAIRVFRHETRAWRLARQRKAARGK